MFSYVSKIYVLSFRFSFSIVRIVKIFGVIITVKWSDLAKPLKAMGGLDEAQICLYIGYHHLISGLMFFRGNLKPLSLKHVLKWSDFPKAVSLGLL